MVGHAEAMASWAELQASVPEFAAGVRGIFDKGRHKTMATVRADGSPRISGIEAEFVDGELTFGSMAGSNKGADLRRDPRLAIHSPSLDPPEDVPESWQGDAKITGKAVLTHEVTDGEAPGPRFRVDIEEAVRVRVGEPADHLLIEVWRPDSGLRRIARR